MAMRHRHFGFGIKGRVGGKQTWFEVSMSVNGFGDISRGHRPLLDGEALDFGSWTFTGYHASHARIAILQRPVRCRRDVVEGGLTLTEFQNRP